MYVLIILKIYNKKSTLLHTLVYPYTSIDTSKETHKKRIAELKKLHPLVITLSIGMLTKANADPLHYA